MIQKLLILSNIIKIVVLLSLIIAELNCLANGIAYRFQYLLMLYFILPGIIILGIIEYFGLIKLKLGKDIIALFPFIIGLIIFILMDYEGRSNPITLSWAVVFSLVIGIILFLKSGHTIMNVGKGKI